MRRSNYEPPNFFVNKGNRTSPLRLGLVVTVSILSLSILYYSSTLLAIRSPTNFHNSATQASAPAKSQVLQSWGHYSPYFDVPSTISPDLPSTCHFTFAQLLSRHGARDPTAVKSLGYQLLVDRIQRHVESFTGPYRFLEKYSYELGADQLTAFGEHQLFLSGKAFYTRYDNLSRDRLPFIRTSSQERVVKSAENFARGYHEANLADKGPSESQRIPPIAVVISEGDGSNNTLSIRICPAFNSEQNLEVGLQAKATWAATFVPATRDRLNRDLSGAELTVQDVIELMDLCPFETVASPELNLSPFCGLFTVEEWKSYDYYQALDKYYGHSMGNPLAPTLGVGFVNELIARLTQRPVEDETCTNHTLDSSNATFPLDARLYADFSHDNDMEAIFAALGLYNTTKPLPMTSIQDPRDSYGFSAAWTVPFAARMYVEKMVCGEEDNEYVRIIINNRVMPLQTCGADDLGRCTLPDFVQSLRFARTGGLWEKCFIS